MVIRNKLAKYRSGQSHSLEIFKLEPHGHLQKTWKSKDGKIQFVKSMQTMHLWFTYRMLLGIIETEQFYLNGSEPNGEMAQDAFSSELDTVMEQADMARNAIQYIGHELYKREMMVPNLPEKNIKKKINRADNLHHGFVDSPGELLNYNDE